MVHTSHINWVAEDSMNTNVHQVDEEWTTKPRIVYHQTVSFKYRIHNNNLIQNSQAVKKVCDPQKGYGEKRCEIQGGGQERAVMVG